MYLETHTSLVAIDRKDSALEFSAIPTTVPQVICFTTIIAAPGVGLWTMIVRALVSWHMGWSVWLYEPKCLIRRRVPTLVTCLIDAPDRFGDYCIWVPPSYILFQTWVLWMYLDPGHLALLGVTSLDYLLFSEYVLNFPVKKNSAKPPLDITWNSLGVHCHGHHASGLVMMDLIPSMRSQVEVICPQLCLYLGLSWCTHGSSPECPVQLWNVLLSHLLKQISFPFYHTFTAPWPQLITICCESPFSLRPCQRSYGTKWWTL